MPNDRGHEADIAAVAHEIRNALTEIVSANGMLRRHWDTVDPARREQLLGLVAHGAARIKHLVDDLLLVHQLESGAFPFAVEQVRLASLLERSVRRDETIHGVAIKVACPDDLWVLADPVRVEQILENLVANAVRYGGAPICIRAAPRGPVVEVGVHDAGKGIPDPLAQRLFERFPHGASAFGHGTGLGLSIVRALSRGQGGDAWYEVDAEGHTCFVFTLPVARRA